jgi:glycosyltransferase involved in cell wall biosynthesis
VKTAATIPATVAICTYNGAARIGMVIEDLAVQTQPFETWELLVIDNASTDGAGEVAHKFIKEILRGRGRVVREERPGLSFARARAAQEAQGEIICFLDDDNIPEPDFVRNAIQAFGEHPKAGLIGGKVAPRWECDPTPLALAVADYALAICDRGKDSFRYEGIASGPVGAGMCIRTCLLRELYSDNALSQITGRKGNALGASEDTALVVRVHQAGWEVWYEQSLHIAHLIPAGRMQKEYLLRLYDGFGRSDVHVRALHDAKARIKLLRVAIGLKDFGRWISRKLTGPSKQLRQQHPDVAKVLHELEQRMTLSRSLEAIWPKAN